VTTGPVPLLLVEDSSDDVLLIRRALRKANAPVVVHVADDGVKGMQYLGGEGVYADRETHPFPALVLLDLKLPRRSGFEVLTWLRAQPGLRRLRVVVLTSSREGPDIDRAYELGANSYLVKPVDFATLHELIADVARFWLERAECPTVDG
jgi:CheY-like chemotaxis protein